MILSWLILTLSLAMVFFYFQVTCQKILRRRFDQEYFRSIANVTRLEFPFVRGALEQSAASLDYSRLPTALKCDFLALTLSLRNTADAKPGYSTEHRLLIHYCRVQFLSLAVRRFLRVGEGKAASRLTSIPTFAELADQFLSWAKPNLSKATVKLHRVNIQRLKQFFRGNLINELDRKSVEDFRVWRASQKRENGEGKVSGATVNRNLTTLKRIYNHADAMGLNVRNRVRHVPYFKETGRVRALTPEEVDKYLAAAKGDSKDFAVLALDTGARPMELLALDKNDVHLMEGYVSLPGTKNVRARRDAPLTDGAKEVLEGPIGKSPNGYIFPVRRRKTKHKEMQHITSLKKAHERIIAEYFADDPFRPYTFRNTYGTRQSQAGTELPVLAELMGHAEIQTTMICVRAAR